MNTLIFITIVAGLELIIWIKPIWDHLRKYVAGGVLIAVSVSSGLVLATHLNILSLLFGLLSIYRVINLLRIVENRGPLQFMRKQTFTSSAWLISAQLLLGGSEWAYRSLTFEYSAYLTIVEIIIALASVYFVLYLKKNMKRVAIDEQLTAHDQKNAPTVSILIPARNETDDLEKCLESLISSNYSKLEILVLDDCSQNKQTPQIIKDFAHAGVRFIAGSTPPEHWLAKNYAYQQLLEAASGDIVIFCGVDSRFESHTISSIVSMFLDKKLDMLSLLPVNTPDLYKRFEGYLIQPIRYGWEIATPRNWKKRPPVLSTGWVTRKGFLLKHGGFTSIKYSTSVESYFARHAFEQSKKYRLISGNQVIGFTSTKKTDEQRATAIRTRYPQTHRRPEIVGLLSVSELLLWIVPYVLFLYAVLDSNLLLALIALCNCAISTYFYSLLYVQTYTTKTMHSIWLFPLAALYDVWLLNYSMWQYEFNEVIWKGRNVCIPIMRYGGQEHQSSS